MEYIWRKPFLRAAGANFMDELRESLHSAFVTLADQYGVPPECRHFIMGQPVNVI
jgi:universal stress protein E